MKRLTSLWRELANESASWCGTSAVRDYQTVASRVDQEGESFLTITLPQFCKDFEKSLELGSIDPNLFSGFRKRRGLPLFLGGFLGQVFDTEGVLFDVPSIDCIRSIRQLTLVFGKIERLCSPERQARAMQQYVDIEVENENFKDSTLLKEIFPLFSEASKLLWADVFSFVENSVLDSHQLVEPWSELSSPSAPVRKFGNPMDSILGLPGSDLTEYSVLPESNRFMKMGEIFDCEVVNPARLHAFVPRHGPGATADRLRGNAKFSISKWPRRLERHFPYGEYALPQLAHYDELDRVHFLEPDAEVPVKVTPVPKTDKTVRIIAEEPTAMQYMQQAFFLQFVNRLEEALKFQPPKGRKSFDLGNRFIGFRHQEPNRFLAEKGSRDGSLATLDLSEASDRVLNRHVMLLMDRFPRLSEAIQATRSTKADVPGHGVIPLAKFSSMGSALCFPMEAMIFTTIVFCAIAYERRAPITYKFIMDLEGQVRVYGDDIIIPIDCVHRVIQFLELFGLKVNKDKSFWNGKFRESCGGDFYDGEWVTPVRCRQELPRSLVDVDGVVGLVAFRNLLYWNGYWKTASSIDDRLSVLLRGRWKVANVTAAGLTRESALAESWFYQVQPEWIDLTDGLYEPRIAGATVWRPIPKSPTSGSGALLKFLLKRGVIPSQDENHLERQGRPQQSRIKLRGIRTY